jgi:hypothetical protein
VNCKRGMAVIGLEVLIPCSLNTVTIWKICFMNKVSIEQRRNER